MKDGEIQGFKKTSDKLKNLEDFSIYLEINAIDLDEEWGIESIDLYTEVGINIQSRLKDVIYLANLFKQSVDMERIIPITDVTEESIWIHSNIDDVFSSLEEGPEMFFSDKHVVSQKIRFMLSEFCLFITCIHDMMLKKKSLEKILEEIQNGESEKNSERQQLIL